MYRPFRSVQRSPWPSLTAVAGLAALLALPTAAIGSGAGHSALRGGSVRGQDVICGSKGWEAGHLSVYESSCQISAFVMWANDFNNWNASQSFNFSFLIGGLAEINPAGLIDRYSYLLQPVNGDAAITFSPTQTNLSINETHNVTTASGAWMPGAFAPGGTEPTTGPVVGNVTVQVVFNFPNLTSPGSSGGGNSSVGTNVTNQSGPSISGVKFGVDIVGWPWANAQDHLGFWISCLAPGAAHFAWNATAQTLAESWNSTGIPIAALEMGGNASVSGPGSVNVTSVPGLFHAGTPDRGAILLVNFNSTAGGYGVLHYDPWVLFALPGLPGIPRGPSTPNPTHGAGGVPSSTGPPPTIASVAIGVGATAAIVLAAVATRARKAPPESGLAPVGWPHAGVTADAFC